MRWTRSSYSSLTPKIEHLFWALHATMLLGLFSWSAFSWPEAVPQVIAWSVIAAYSVIVVGGFFYSQRLPTSFGTALWTVMIADLATLGWVISLTGGIASDYYILFFALVPFLAYNLTLRDGLAVVLMVSVGYFFLTVPSAGVGAIPTFAFRVVLLAMFTATTGLAVRFIQQSEQRLLNALDKLNERTSELERTHTQLQTIYETSRSLGELMAVENVIDRVLSIVRTVLNYPVCEVFTYDSTDGTLWLQGRVDDFQASRFDKPRRAKLTDELRNAIGQGTVQRVIDRHLGRTIIDGQSHRSLLIAPMVSEGKVVGLLKAEAAQVNAFCERDERVFSVLASSTALALVNADLHQRMEKLTVIDELTGLYNYRFFRARLEDEQRRAVRYGQPLSLVMVDIDWFKQLNDQYGHETGNVALRTLAQILQSCIRDVDIPARYGGEEFIVILPQTGLDEAHVIGERMRRRVEGAVFGNTSSGQAIRLTVSIGITCYPDNGRPEDALVESVDQAMYRAKGGGKNLVCTL